MLVLFSLLCASCSSPSSGRNAADQSRSDTNTPKSDPSVSAAPTSSAETPIAPAIRDVTIALDDSPNYEGVVVYPQLENEATPAQRAFNRHVTQLATDEVARFKAFCRREVRRLKESKKPLGFGLRCEYEICFASPEVVSLTLTWASFTGSVNEDHFTMPITFDLRAGKPVELRQLFRKGSKYLQPISTYCIARLKEQHPDPAWDLEESAGPTHANYHTWCVTREGLTVTFGEYQVGPGRIGLVSIQIPYESLADVADPLGALAVAASTKP